MNFNEGLSKIKDVLAARGYNLLGYDHTDAQKNTMEPWFYPKKEKEGLPHEVGGFLNEIKEKYPLAAMRKFRVPGQQNIDLFCGIKADGLSIPEIQAKLREFEDMFHKVEKNRFAKKIKYSKKKGNYISATLCMIYENGLPNDQVETVQSCWKKQKLKKPTPKDMFSTRPFIIDLANKRAYKHKGIPLKTNAPGPDKLAGEIFS